MDIKHGKRVSAKEAAEILGVPYANISRIDRIGSVIKRYKIGYKTHVYELSSLYDFLASCQSKSLQRPVGGGSAGRSIASLQISESDEPSFSLREFLPKARTN